MLTANQIWKYFKAPFFAFTIITLVMFVICYLLLPGYFTSHLSRTLNASMWSVGFGLVFSSLFFLLRFLKTNKKTRCWYHYTIPISIVVLSQAGAILLAGNSPLFY